MLHQEWCQSTSWKKFNFKSVSCSTQDSIRFLQMFCMSVLLLSGGIGSEWKCCNSPLSVAKMLDIQVWIQLKSSLAWQWPICALHKHSHSLVKTKPNDSMHAKANMAISQMSHFVNLADWQQLRGVEIRLTLWPITHEIWWGPTKC